jgi:hypothetical protein
MKAVGALALVLAAPRAAAEPCAVGGTLRPFSREHPATAAELREALERARR